MYWVRPFEEGDAKAVSRLFASYMQEIFNGPSAMSEEVLLRDGRGQHFNLMLAVDGEDAPVGFAAWRRSYDLHHAVWGAEIPDLFVAKESRGRALSIRMAAAIARTIRKKGGLYLKGEVLMDDNKRLRLVRRMTVGFPGESVYLSGKAFRELSEMTDDKTRALVRKLPKPSTSREP